MKKETRDDYLIVISTVVAILATRVSDSLFPSKMNLSFIGNTTIEPIVEFLIKLALLIIFTYTFLALTKWLTKKLGIF